MKYKVAKAFIHLGPKWPAGRTYLIDYDLRLKLQINPDQYRPQTYGYLRKESHDQGSRIKAVIKAEGLDYQEKYFGSKESSEAKKWLKSEVNQQLKRATVL